MGLLYQLVFYCEGQAFTSVLPFYIVVAVAYDGHNCRPKHDIVNVIHN